MPISTSRITQASQYSGINIRDLSTNATINITPLTNLNTLNVSSANNNINSTKLDFNNFPNIQYFSSEGSNRSLSNAGIYLNLDGTNSSLVNYTAFSSKVTSLALKNPTNMSFPGANSQVGQIPTGLTYLNIQENGLGGQDLTSILLSFSGMAKTNDITGGYLNVVPADSFQSLTPQFPNKKGYYREFWTSDNGQYQLAALLNDGNNPGNIFLSTNYGIDFSSIFTGLNFRSVCASNDLSRIVVVARFDHAYMSTNGGATFSIINTGISTGTKNYTDIAMSSNGQYINLTVNGNPNFDGALYCSNDYGATFTKGGGPVANATIARWVSTDISSNGQYQIACMNNGTYPALLRSIDYGVNWTYELFYSDLTDVTMSSDGRYQSATAGRIWRSSDYGDNWAVAYQDYTKVSNTYSILNTDWRGGVSLSSDGKYQIAGLTSVYELVPAPFYRYQFQSLSGYLVTSSNYGVTWQRTNFRDFWGSCNLSANGLHMLAGSRDGLFYTSRTDGADTIYGTYLSRAFNAVQYLRNVKNWTVQFIQGFFDI
jgi:hypothetical protein